MKRQLDRDISGNMNSTSAIVQTETIELNFCHKNSPSGVYPQERAILKTLACEVKDQVDRQGVS
jgi:hypothetical protein